MKSFRLIPAALGFLSACALAGGAAPATTTEYMAVMLGGSKIGYGINTRTVTPDEVINKQFAHMTIGRPGMAITVEQVSETVETPDGHPRRFQTSTSMGGAPRITRGTVDETGKMTVTTVNGGQEKTRTAQWPTDALMSHGLWLLQKKEGLTEGTKYSFTVFQPEEANAIKGSAVVGKRAEVDLLGRVVELTQVKVAMRMGLGKVVTTNYVDDDFQTLKSIIPMLGMKFEAIACSKTFALSEGDVVDFFDKLVLKSPAPLQNAAAAGGITYTLRQAPGADVQIPQTDNQTVTTAQDGAIIVTVRPVAAAADQPLPYKGTDPAALAALKPTEYLQSKDPTIVTLAGEAIGDATDAATAATRIEAFVRKYIKTKDLSVGYATAAEVAQSRQGDCTEHAALAAALCRAAGIPAQIVTGMGYVSEFGTHQNSFGPHAWVRTYIGGKWVGLDAALEGYDARHITLSCGDGDMEDFFSVVSSLGYFKIEKVDVGK